jgi:hypothetical protein
MIYEMMREGVQNFGSSEFVNFCSNYCRIYSCHLKLQMNVFFTIEICIEKIQKSSNFFQKNYRKNTEKI